MKKKIKIGYTDVDIQIIDKKLFPKWSSEHLGDYDANNQLIRILSKQRPSEELNTLFHEVMHAAVQMSGLNADKGPLKKMMDEEQVVSVLANTLQQIFRDNTWFLPYVIKQIGADKSGSKTRAETFSRLKKAARKSKQNNTFSKSREPNRARNSRSKLQRTLKQEHLKLFEGSGTRDLGTWSPVFELPLPVPASRSDFPLPVSRSDFPLPVSRLPFVEVFDYIKHNY
jgi:hypothetical protein